MSKTEFAPTLLNACESGYETCVALLGELIACRSFSGQEKECADTLLNWCQNQRIPACVDSRGSVIAVAPPALPDLPAFPQEPGAQRGWIKELLRQVRARGMQILAYNAHIDVVEADAPEKWQTPPFQASRRDGRIYGRGTCDMKGALAAMATALLLVKQLDSELKRNCLVLGCFVTEEEAGEGLAFKELCEEFALQPDMVLLGEPSQMQIARGQRGKLEFHVETRGKTAHTSVPEVGDNAAYKMARVLMAIERLDEAERNRHGLEAEQILKRNTLVATSIQSWPASRSFVPDRARIHVTARTALNSDLSVLSARLQSCKDWPEAEIVPVVYRGLSYTGKSSDWPSDHPAWETSREHCFFQTLKELYAEILQREAKDKIWPFSTDGVYSAGMAKIPTLGLGPGLESCAHIIDEWVAETQLKEALQIYAALPFAFI